MSRVSLNASEMIDVAAGGGGDVPMARVAVAMRLAGRFRINDRGGILVRIVRFAAGALVLAALLAGCAASHPGGPATAGPSPSAAASLLAPLTFGWGTLGVDPSSYRVHYYSGKVVLRVSPGLSIGWRYDVDHRGPASELLKSNMDFAAQRRVTPRPVQLPGGTGVTYDYVDSGHTTRVYVGADDALTWTVTADLGATPDTATAALTDALAQSVRADVGRLSGAWPGSATAPGVPLTFTTPAGVPAAAVTAGWASFMLDLHWGDQAWSRMTVDQYSSGDAAVAAYKKVQGQMLVVPGRRLKDPKNPVTCPGLDDGWTIRTGTQDQPTAVGVYGYHATYVVRLVTTVTEGADVYSGPWTAALNAPAQLCGGWSWRA